MSNDPRNPQNPRPWRDVDLSKRPWQGTELPGPLGMPVPIPQGDQPEMASAKEALGNAWNKLNGMNRPPNKGSVLEEAKKQINNLTATVIELMPAGMSPQDVINQQNQQGGAGGMPPLPPPHTPVDNGMAQQAREAMSQANKSMSQQVDLKIPLPETLSPQQSQAKDPGVGGLQGLWNKMAEGIGSKGELSSLFGGSGKLGSAAKDAQLAMRGAAGDPIALLELAKKKAEERFEDFKGGFNQLGKALSSDRAEQTASGLMGAGAKFSDAAFGRDNAIGYMFKFGQAIADSIEKIRDWSNQLHESNMQFAEFSESMAQVQAQSDFEQFQIKRQKGEERAESAGKLAESKNRLDRELAPIENEWAKFKNTVGAGLNNLLSDMVGGIKSVIDPFGVGINKEDITKHGSIANNWFAEEAGKAWSQRHGAPPENFWL